MNRVMRGTVLLAAALASVSCQGDPTGSLRNGVDHLVATPSAIFVGNNTSKTVIVTAVDEQGNTLGTNFTLGNVGAGITVVPDDSFNLIFNEKGQLVPPKNWSRAQFIVSTGNYVSSSFVVTAGGKSVTIPVRTSPLDLTSNFATTTPAVGASLTLDAPAGLAFDPLTTTVTFSPGGAAVIVSISTTSITFVPIPGSSGVATVTNITPLFDPALGPLTLTTTQLISVPTVSNVAAVFSTSTPNVNDNVTVTAPNGFKFLPSAKIFFGTDQQTVLSVAADSNSLVFRAHAAGASGTVTMSNIALSSLTTLPITSTITATANVGATITSLAGTDVFATAPNVVIPDSGKSGGIVDAGAFAAGPAVCNGTLGGPCRIYTFTIATSRTFGVNASWQGTTDLGIYFTDPAGALTGTTACDSKGAGASGQPESCTATFAAGTYFMVVDSFSPFYGPPNNVDPTNFSVAFTGQ